MQMPDTKSEDFLTNKIERGHYSFIENKDTVYLGNINCNDMHPVLKRKQDLPKKYSIFFFDEDRTVWSNFSTIERAEIAAHKVDIKIDCIIYDDSFTKENPISQRKNGVWK